MIESAMKTLRASQLAALSVKIRYSRDGSITTHKAIVGRTIFRSTNDYGEVMRIVSRDYIVPTTEMDFDPKMGDIITEGDREYEVLAIKGESSWRWSDPQHSARRIHTKQIGGEE